MCIRDRNEPDNQSFAARCYQDDARPEETLGKLSRYGAGPVSYTHLILTGGGSLVCGLDKLLAEVTHVPAVLADDPISCVARGTGRALEVLDQLKGMTLFDEPRKRM